MIITFLTSAMYQLKSQSLQKKHNKTFMYMKIYHITLCINNYYHIDLYTKNRI